MKYVLQNIRTLVKNEKFIFAVMLLCVFVSAWVMTFSYGLYHNYNRMLSEESEAGLELPIMIAGDLTRGDLVRYLTAISPQTLDAMNSIFTESDFEFHTEVIDMHSSLVSRFVIRNGEFIPSPYVIQVWNDESMIISGRYISDYEEANGEKVILVKEYFWQKREFYKGLFKDDETMTINGEDYKIICVHLGGSFVVPLHSIPEDAKMGPFIELHFEKPYTQKQYDEIVSVAETLMPGMFKFLPPEFKDDQDIFIYQNMLIVSGLIAALTIINFAFLYSFILRKRSRTLAIMRICGCTKGRARLICLGECCLICIPTFLVGVLTFIPFMHGVLSNLFEYIEGAYSLAVYGLLFAIFTAMLLLVMWILLSRQIRRELAEARKGGAA